ncbi:hypothetical protein V2J09_000489 [Rumex salicifolius]
MFVSSTPEYMEIYERFKVAKYSFMPPPTYAFLGLSTNMPRPSNLFLQIRENDIFKSSVVII